MATDSEPASYQWGYSQVRAASGVIAAYARADTRTPSGPPARPRIHRHRDRAVGHHREGGLDGRGGVRRQRGCDDRATRRHDGAGEIVSATRIRTEVSDLAPSSAGATGAEDGDAATAAANIGQLIALRPILTPRTSRRRRTSASRPPPASRGRSSSGIDADTCELTFDRAAATLPSGAMLTAPVDAPCSGPGPFEDTATVTYTAPVGFSGPDSFGYSVRRRHERLRSAPVTISVSPPLVAPPTSSCAGPGRTTVTTPPGTVTTPSSAQPVDDTTFDAAGTIWRPDLITYPIIIDAEAARLCWLDGAVYGSDPAEMTWEEAHDLNQPCIRIIATEWMVVEGLRCDNTDDGLAPARGGTGRTTSRCDRGHLPDANPRRLPRERRDHRRRAPGQPVGRLQHRHLRTPQRRAGELLVSPPARPSSSIT